LDVKQWANFAIKRLFFSKKTTILPILKSFYWAIASLSGKSFCV
jgi:hypothetical protein